MLISTSEGQVSIPARFIYARNFVPAQKQGPKQGLGGALQIFQELRSCALAKLMHSIKKHEKNLPGAASSREVHRWISMLWLELRGVGLSSQFDTRVLQAGHKPLGNALHETVAEARIILQELSQRLGLDLD